MRKKSMKILSAVLSTALAAACLTGCGADKTEKNTQDAAMGRYLESDVELPDCKGPFDMVLMEDGTLRVALETEEGKGSVWDMKKDGEWEKAFDIEVDMEDYAKSYLSVVALDKEGKAGILAYMEPKDAKEGELEDVVYYQMDSSGKAVKAAYQPENFGYHFQYSPDNELYYQNAEFKLMKVNLETGEETPMAAEQDYVNFYGFSGNKLLVGDYQMNLYEYDLESGDPLPADEILQESIKNSNMVLSDNAVQMGAMPVIFCGREEKDTFFYCGSSGLYCHSEDGNVSEKLIDGTLTSMGNPDLGLLSLEFVDDEFYLLAAGTNGAELLKYTYSSDIPTVPDKEITAFTLYENTELQQAISMYQKKNPEVYVKYVVGMSGEDSMTVSDVLRTLNTEIVAGDGPDLLLTDGMPVDSYIEKGLLEDVTELVEAVDKEEGLFTNITSARQKDGKLYAVPLRFYMPVIQGSKETLERVTDLKSLADEAERLKAENPDRCIAGTDFFTGKVLASRLYAACSGAWIREDGSVDEAALAEFYTQLKRIYDCDVRNEEEYFDYPNDALNYYSNIMSGLVLTYADKQAVNFGNVSEPMEIAAFAKTSEESQTSYKCLQGQTENSFQEGSVAGVSSKSKEKETALDFMRFLLMEEAQSASQGNGMPVNRAATEALMGKNKLTDITIGDRDPENQEENILVLLTGVSKEALEDYIQKTESLTTPGLSNEIVRTAVLDQADGCVKGDITPKEAVKAVTDTVNLYLAEN